MTIKSLSMAIAVLSLLSCSKSSSSAAPADNRPLKAVPHSTFATHNGSGTIINLETYESEGPITHYKWERADTNLVSEPASFINSTTWNDVSKASVTQVSTPYHTALWDYVFTLTVYDKDGNSNSQFFTVLVSQ
jgi:hypothetical protein